MKIQNLAFAAVFAVAAFSGIARADHHGKEKDLIAVASGAGSFSTLVEAVKAAGLEETLQGSGPFTVFAPGDDAFAKLPKGTDEDLLKPENKEKLVAILMYYVVPGKVMAADVKTMQAKTVNGKPLQLRVAGNRSPDLGGLCLAGGSAHPGPGMPMVLMSGWIAAAISIAMAGRALIPAEGTPLRVPLVDCL
jgi:hypothetical protein